MSLLPLARQLLAPALAALMLCLPAWWNGQPLLYPDMPTYLRGAETGVHRWVGSQRLPSWLPPSKSGRSATDAHPLRTKGLTSLDDRIVLAGRSVYYGALLYASHLAGGLGWTVLVQALCVAYLLHLLMVRRWGLAEPTFLAAIAMLALATPLAVYTSLLMPDVFAGLGVLATASLAVYWRRLSQADRWALGALLLFSLAAHASHVAVVAVLWLLALGLRRWRAGWEGLSLPALLVVAGCLAGALAGEALFHRTVTRSVGAPPLRLPHATARLVEMGPGTDLLRQRCPEAGYAACAFADHFPTSWTDFLFSTDPQRGAFALADAPTQRRLSDEQLRFALDVLRGQPVRVLGSMVLDWGRQLTQFGVDVWGYGARELAMYEGRVPPELFATLTRTRAVNTRAYNQAFTALSYASVLGSLALAWTWVRRRGDARWPPPASLPQRFGQLAWLAGAGVVANAGVCATLAAPLDRFQARVVWLLPLLAVSVLAMARQRRRHEAIMPARSPANPTLQGVA